MKIIPNIYVKVRKLWNTMFGKDGDGDEVKLIKANPTAGESDPDLTGLEIDGNKYKIPEATEVVANPTLAGTEPALSGLQVGNDKFTVPTPTEVIANPTLAGTEADLSGLQVGNTKYKVPSGGATLYQHIITMGGDCTVVIINNSSTPFTLNTFVQWLYDNNFRTAGETNTSLCVSGLHKISSTKYAIGVYAATRTQSEIGCYGYEISIVDNAIVTARMTDSIYNLGDRVIAI